MATFLSCPCIESNCRLFSELSNTLIEIKVQIADDFALCYRKSDPVLCDKSHDPESPYYQPLNPCIAGTRSKRWIPIEHRTTWPSQARLNSTELDIHGKY
jgi:hypothetical protein